MPYFIHKDDPSIITVRYDGNVDIKERMNAVDNVCDLVRSQDTVNLLIDVRNITMNMSRDEQIYLGKYLADKKELSTAKVAVVHIPTNNPNQLINAVAYTEGYEVVDFDNVNQASQWLNGNLR